MGVTKTTICLCCWGFTLRGLAKNEELVSVMRSEAVVLYQTAMCPSIPAHVYRPPIQHQNVRCIAKKLALVYYRGSFTRASGGKLPIEVLGSIRVRNGIGTTGMGHWHVDCSGGGIWGAGTRNYIEIDSQGVGMN